MAGDDLAPCGLEFLGPSLIVNGEGELDLLRFRRRSSGHHVFLPHFRPGRDRSIADTARSTLSAASWEIPALKSWHGGGESRPAPERLQAADFGEVDGGSIFPRLDGRSFRAYGLCHHESTVTDAESLGSPATNGLCRDDESWFISSFRLNSSQAFWIAGSFGIPPLRI